MDVEAPRPDPDGSAARSAGENAAPDPTAPLRDDHRLIRHVLAVLEELVGRAARGEKLEIDPVDAALVFFRDFEHGAHHAREELLLEALETAGVEPAGGPPAMVAEEHALGAGLLESFEAAAEAFRTAGEPALPELLREARTYAGFLRRHADKEEHCLFGFADRVLAGGRARELAASTAALAADPALARREARAREAVTRELARRGMALPAPPVLGNPPPGAAPASPERASGPMRWREAAVQLPPDPGSELEAQVRAAFDSPPVRALRAALARVGAELDPTPLLSKVLPGGHLRIFFPVRGGPAGLEAGQVVAAVLLHDLASGRTLYAHPVHAGPGANPLLRHLGGPMARPKAQEGENGDRATLRLLEHKRAIWAAFREEATRAGEAAAARWRERYAFALVRLYFCERCSACRWGHPSYDGAGVSPWTPPEDPGAGAASAELSEADRELGRRAAGSEAFAVERAYARRGGFEISREPILVGEAGPDTVVVFPSDARLLEAGSLVGAAAHLDRASGTVRHVHCLSAGPEPEMVFLHGDRALGLGVPGDDAARRAYARFREEAWTRFWLRELEEGLAAASRAWLAEYRDALARLLGRPPAGA